MPPPLLRNAPAVVGAGFGLGIGETSGPLHTEFASYFIRPDRKVLADSSAWRATLPIQRRQVWEQLQADRVRLVLSSLRQQAKVEDRRLEFERAQREAAQQQGLPQSPLGF